MSAVTASDSGWRRHLADSMTSLRVFVTGGVIYALTMMVMGSQLPTASLWWWMCGLCAVAGATDYLDGLFARKYGSNPWGAFYDSTVDKICFSVFAILVVFFHPYGFHLLEITCLLGILIRELGMGVGRAVGGPKLFPVQPIGKLKMVVQFISLTLYCAPLPQLWDWARWSLVLATVLTAVSLYMYIHDWWCKRE